MAGEWFAAEPADEQGFSFAGCTVAPGFDFRDFEMAKAEELLAAYPDQAALISKRCR
jgi:predicted cupin superfamily sugar epimerase